MRISALQKNQRIPQLLTNYLYPTPDQIATLLFIAQHIPQGSCQLLWVGAQIGQLPQAVLALHPELRITALDRNPERVEVAKLLFGQERLSFQVHDFTAPSQLAGFELIVIPDLLDYISATGTTQLAANLLQNQPAPIIVGGFSERQSLKLAKQLAAQLGYTLAPSEPALGRWQSILYPATAKLVYKKAPALPLQAGIYHPAAVTAMATRLQVLPARCGMLQAAVPQSPRVALFVSTTGTYSESFVRAHCRELAAQVFLFYGGLFPLFDHRGQLLAPPNSCAASQTQALAEYLLKHQITVAIAEYGTTGVKVLEACRRANCQLIVHFHGYDAHKESVVTANLPGYKKLFKYATAIIAVSQTMVATLVRLGAPPQLVHHIPCGASEALFEQQANPQQAPPLLITVGRFVDKKAPYLALAAFRLAVAARPQAQMVMIGDGPLLATCIELAQLWQIADAVTFTGALPQAEVAKKMRGARAFVQHSITPTSGDKEGSPVSIMEASLIGLPVIATAHAGINDIVADGKTGFLVAERDTVAMSAAMIKLIDSPHLSGQMGAMGHARAKQEFTLATTIKKLDNLLAELSSR